MVQDDIVGHVKALPHTQVVEQGGLPAHVAHVHDGDVCEEEVTEVTTSEKLFKN